MSRTGVEQQFGTLPRGFLNKPRVNKVIHDSDSEDSANNSYQDQVIQDSMETSSEGSEIEMEATTNSFEQIIQETPKYHSDNKLEEGEIQLDGHESELFVREVPSGSDTSTLPPESHHSGTIPNYIPTPSVQLFTEAFHDKEKELVVIDYLKSRFTPAFNMIREIVDTMSMGFPEENDFIRVLTHSAAKNPNALNFECKELAGVTDPLV